MALTAAEKAERRRERMASRTEYAETHGVSVTKQTEQAREAWRKERLRREEFRGRRKADPKDPNKTFMWWMEK